LPLSTAVVVAAGLLAVFGGWLFERRDLAV